MREYKTSEKHREVMRRQRERIAADPLRTAQRKLYMAEYRQRNRDRAKAVRAAYLARKKLAGDGVDEVCLRSNEPLPNEVFIDTAVSVKIDLQEIQCVVLS
jgi:hypothetical protein